MLKLARGSLLYVAERTSGRPIVGAEVGVLAGRHAQNMLDNLPGLGHLYLVDPYLESYAIKHKEEAFVRLAEYHDRITWFIKPFDECTEQDISSPLDFVYVDGDHHYEGVCKDLIQAARFVKPHGVICGHDFQMEGVKQAVLEYCETNSRYLTSWGGEWWFLNAPEVDSSMDLPERPPDMSQHY